MLLRSYSFASGNAVCLAFTVFACLGFVLFSVKRHAFKSIKQVDNENRKTTEDVSKHIHYFENGFHEIYNSDFIRYLQRNYIKLPSLRAPTLSGPRITDYSELGQSTVVDSLLGQRRNGFFIECGVGNGEDISNSLFFELQRNWTGVLIEPNEKFYNQIMQKKRNAYVVKACLSPSNRAEQLKFIAAGTGGGLHNSSFTDPRAFKNLKKHGTNNVDILVTVQCFPFMSIIAALGYPMIDYFSLDVEGAELLILQTIDWDKVDIDVMSVEFTSEQKLADLRNLFSNTGIYNEIHLLKHDVIFKKKR